MTAATLNILAIPGSLRRESLNRRLLHAAAARAPAGASIRVHEDLASVPLFNEDLETGGGPKAVLHLREQVAAADGVLIATPEYNQSMPGVVKNLIDWLSRGEPEVLEHKPTAILGATQGMWGTRLAQAALRQTLTACGALIMPAPQVYLRSASELFDPDGQLRDEPTKAALERFVAAFQRWIEAARANR